VEEDLRIQIEFLHICEESRRKVIVTKGGEDSYLTCIICRRGDFILLAERINGESIVLDFSTSPLLPFRVGSSPPDEVIKINA
jgi:hypothetical protein